MRGYEMNIDRKGKPKMQCTFEEKTIHSDGSFLHSKCINKANILVINDPCYGLCYHCAYEKLEVENKWLKDKLDTIKNGVLTFGDDLDQTEYSAGNVAQEHDRQQWNGEHIMNERVLNLIEQTLKGKI